MGRGDNTLVSSRLTNRSVIPESMTKTLTRAQLAEIIQSKTSISLSEAASFVDAVFEEISKALEVEEMIKISSFGTFTVRKKGQRVGRNPKTKVEVAIKPRRVVSFKASNLLKDEVN